MNKKALFIDIKYKNLYLETNSEIKITEMAKLLKNVYNFTNQVFLVENSEREPTKNNILEELNKLYDEEEETSEIWIHYMGHSTTVLDERNELFEKGLLPIDYESEGIITDEEIKDILLKFKCKVIIILDCCYGNYGFNLGYNMKMIDGKYVKYENKKNNNDNNNENNIYAISMYVEEIKNKSYNYSFSNLLTRRICQSIENENYILTLDKIVMRLFKYLHEEAYLYNISLLSSNVPIIGKSYFLNLSQSERLKIENLEKVNYDFAKTDEQIHKEKKDLNENRLKQLFLSIGRVDLYHSFGFEKNLDKKLGSTMTKLMGKGIVVEELKDENKKEKVEKKKNSDVKRLQIPEQVPFYRSKKYMEEMREKKRHIEEMREMRRLEILNKKQKEEEMRKMKHAGDIEKIDLMLRKKKEAEMKINNNNIGYYEKKMKEIKETKNRKMTCEKIVVDDNREIKIQYYMNENYNIYEEDIRRMKMLLNLDDYNDVMKKMKEKIENNKENNS